MGVSILKLIYKILVKIIEIHISNTGSDLFTLPLYLSKSHNKKPEQHQLGESPLIPYELIAEILSCLPVKCLIRFRCVCKSWNSLICDPHFVKLHLHRRRSGPNVDPNVLFIWRSKELHYIKINVSLLPAKSFLESPSTITKESYFLGKFKSSNKGRYKIIGSCNGLVCLLGCRWVRFTARHECHWFNFWNPAMRTKSRKSPKVPTTQENIDQLYFNNYGFGYDHISDTYKVLSISNDIERNHVKVYNMSDDNWRDIGSFPTFLPMRGRTGVHLNGTLNWLAFDNTELIQNGVIMMKLDSESFMIHSFDLKNEEFMEFSLRGMPRVLFEFPGNPKLGVLSDCLCVSHDYMRTHFVVYQMKEFGVEGSWTKLLNICYEDLQPRSLQPQPSSWFPPNWSPPLCMFSNGDILMLQQRFLYNQRDQRLQLLEIPPNSSLDNSQIYYESLVSPFCN